MLQNAYLHAKIGVDPAENSHLGFRVMVSWPIRQCSDGPRRSPTAAPTSTTPLVGSQGVPTSGVAKDTYVATATGGNVSNFCQILANSSQIFASNMAFFSIFQNLQDFAKFCKNSVKFCEFLQDFVNFLENSEKFSQIFAKF